MARVPSLRKTSSVNYRDLIDTWGEPGVTEVKKSVHHLGRWLEGHGGWCRIWGEFLEDGLVGEHEEAGNGGEAMAGKGNENNRGR